MLTKYAVNMHWFIEYSTASYVSNTAPLALFKESIRKELLAEFGTSGFSSEKIYPGLLRLGYIENKDLGPISCHICNSDYQLRGLNTVTRNVKFLYSEC